MLTMPEWILTGFLSLFSVVVGWGIRRLVGGHDTLTEHVADATTAITKVCGQVDTTLYLLQSNKAVCDERDRNNLTEHERVLDRIERMK